MHAEGAATTAGNPLVRPCTAPHVVASECRLSATRHYRTANGTQNEVGPAVFRDFLPAALAAGSYAAVPRSSVVGSSLADVQHAMDLQRRGVSATKLVVTL